MTLLTSAQPLHATAIGYTGSHDALGPDTRAGMDAGLAQHRGHEPRFRQMRGRGPARLGSAAQTQGALHLVL